VQHGTTWVVVGEAGPVACMKETHSLGLITLGGHGHTTLFCPEEETAGPMRDLGPLTRWVSGGGSGRGGGTVVSAGVLFRGLLGSIRLVVLDEQAGRGVICPRNYLVELVEHVINKLTCLIVFWGLDLGEVSAKGVVDHDGVIDKPSDKDGGLVDDASKPQEDVSWAAGQHLEEVPGLARGGKRKVFVTEYGMFVSPCQWLI